MRGVVALAWSGVRHRWRSLGDVGGGAATATVAASRRSLSAVPCFEKQVKPLVDTWLALEGGYTVPILLSVAVGASSCSSCSSPPRSQASGPLEFGPRPTYGRSSPTMRRQ